MCLAAIELLRRDRVYANLLLQNRDMNVNFAKIKEATDKEAKKIFEEKILNLLVTEFLTRT